MDLGDKQKIDMDVGDQVVEDPIDFSMEEIDVANSSDDSMVKPACLNEPIVDVSTNTKMKHDQEYPQSQVGFVDFLGVQQYDWILHIHIVDLINQLKHAEKISLQVIFGVEHFWKGIKKLKFSKYLFLWNGRWQISNENSWASSFEEKENDVGQDIEPNYLWKYYFSNNFYLRLVLGDFICTAYFAHF